MDPSSLDGASLEPDRLGMVVGGSIAQGVEVRLDGEANGSVEDIKVGTFVTIQGRSYRFFGVVTDISLGATDARLKHSPPDVDDPFIADIVAGTVAYGSISVLPNLTLPLVLGSGEGPAAAKTIPGPLLQGLFRIGAGRGPGLR